MSKHRLRSEKIWLSDLRTGVRPPSPPPQDRDSNRLVRVLFLSLEKVESIISCGGETLEYLIRNGAVELWVADTGPREAPVCILCSGGPGCCDYMEPVARMIDDRLRVIRFEQRGCGRSIKDGLYDIKTAINDMERVREALNIEAWTVGGHSWGANLALFYVLAYPKRSSALLYLAGNGVQHNQEWDEVYHTNLEAQGEPLPVMTYSFNADVNRQENAVLSACINSRSHVVPEDCRLGYPLSVCLRRAGCPSKLACHANRAFNAKLEA